jgi:hypothetical protein
MVVSPVHGGVTCIIRTAAVHRSVTGTVGTSTVVPAFRREVPTIVRASAIISALNGEVTTILSVPLRGRERRTVIVAP